MPILIRGKEVTQKSINRFWARVAIQEDQDACWLWQAGMNSKVNGYNYGIFWVNGGNTLTHRFALSVFNGVLVSDELDVLHNCDNPPCCNPNHLRAGTHTDNMQDKIERGRGNFNIGEDRPAAKLNDNLVRKIRHFYRMREKYKKYTVAYMARLCDVDYSLIHMVVKDQIWKHVK